MLVNACLHLTEAAELRLRTPNLTFFPSKKFGLSILSSVASRARTQSQYAWWPGN